MPTLKQRKVAKKLVEAMRNNATPTGGSLLAEVGYSQTMQTAKVNDVLESKGVKEALTDLGFSLEAADNVVFKILNNGKEENRLKASDQIYKRLGGYAPDKSINLNVEVQASPEIKALTEKLNELYKK
jgi:hypothetical protein